MIICMKKDMWIAILASLGVGAAAYYTISKSDNPMNKAMESVAPMLNDLMSTNNTNNSLTNSSSSEHKHNHTEEQTLGPFGMS